jgi:hypothetical protein
MKKIGLIATFFISFFLLNTKVSGIEDTVVYPMDSITITSAFTFDVEVKQEPSTESYLYGKVNPGEILSIYVGELEFKYEQYTDESQILIVTNEAGEDIIRWITNGGSNYNNIWKSEFSSHITVDPNVGVVKTNDDLGAYKAYVKIINTHLEADRNYLFIDDTATIYEMIPNTLQEEHNLSIVISTYVDPTEQDIEISEDVEGE